MNDTFNRYFDFTTCCKPTTSPKRQHVWFPTLFLSCISNLLPIWCLLFLRNAFKFRGLFSVFFESLQVYSRNLEPSLPRFLLLGLSSFVSGTFFAGSLLPAIAALLIPSNGSFSEPSLLPGFLHLLRSNSFNAPLLFLGRLERLLSISFQVHDYSWSSLIFLLFSGGRAPPVRFK